MFSIGAVSTATGILLYNHDYDYRATAALGIGSGAILLVGAIYNEKAEKWKLRVTPTINFNEPGGGLFLQLGF